MGKKWVVALMALGCYVLAGICIYLIAINL